MADFDFVQSPDCANDNGGPTDLAFGSNVTAGNLVIAAISRSPNSDTATVSSQAGTATTSAWARAVQLNAGQHIEVWWAEVTGTGSLTVRAAFSASVNNIRLAIGEYVGPAGGTEVIDTASNANAATTTPTSGDCTFTAAGLLVGALTPTTQAVTPTAGTGFTIREASAIDGFNFEDQKKASAGNLDADWTTNVSEASSCVAVAFQEVGAGGGAAAVSIVPLIQNYRNMGLMQ